VEDRTRKREGGFWLDWGECSTFGCVFSFSGDGGGRGAPPKFEGGKTGGIRRSTTTTVFG